MKNRIMLVSMVVFMSVGVNAQISTTNVARTTFGLTGGVNWNNINGKSSTGADLDNKARTGFKGGLNVEFPVAPQFYLQPGVEYRQKGAEMGNGSKLRLSYIDVPVNLLFKPLLGKGSLLLGAGPYVGFGVNGDNKTSNGIESDVKFNNTYMPSETAIQYKKMDAGANFMVGYEAASMLSLALKAQLGIMNINPDMNTGEDQSKSKNTGFGLSIGYRL